MIRKGTGKKAILMLHGRGGNAEDILSLSEHFNAVCFAFTAEGCAWYPYSFLKFKKENEPYLSSSLKKIHDAVVEIKKEFSEVYLLGFSQGACLALEYGAMHEVSGVIGFSGGLIGDRTELLKKAKTKKVFISCSSKDPFIPLERAMTTAKIYSDSGAFVSSNFYTGSTHTITSEDLELAKKLVN